MKFDNVLRSYYTLNKKEIKTKSGKIYYKLSLYNYEDDDFVSLFVEKPIFDKCVLNKTHVFACNLIIVENQKPMIKIVDIISTK